MKKRIKYIFTLFIITALFVAICLPTSAAANDMHGADILITAKNKSYDNYTCQIETILESLVNEKELQNNSNIRTIDGTTDLVETYDISNAYRVYITETFFLTKLNENNSFEDTLTDKMQWIVPITTQKSNSGLVTLNEDDGVLSWSANTIGKTSEILYITDAKIEKAIKEATNISGDFDDMKIAHSYMYYTTFVYLKSGKQEFLIPFSVYSDEIGITNGKLYIVSEIQKKFNNCFDENILIENGELNAGLPFRKQTYYFEIITTIIGFVGITILSIYIIVKRNKKAQ